MVEIHYSPRFAKMYKKLPVHVQEAAEAKEVIFRQNPFAPKLKTHRLTGKLKDYWAFYVSGQYRIIFSFVSKQIVNFHAVGPHDIYKKFQS